MAAYTTRHPIWTKKFLLRVRFVCGLTKKQDK